MKELAADADNLQLAERLESDSSSQGSQNQNVPPDQNIERFESDCSSQGYQNQDDLPGQDRELYHSKFVPLYNAAVNGYWKEALRLIEEDPRLVYRAITEGGETALHVATGAGQVSFVERLIDFIPEEALAMKDGNGNTPFCIAAAAGCKEIVKVMLKRSPPLLQIRGSEYLTPLNMAVLLGKREMASFLYRKGTSYLTSDDENRLFFDSITSDLYDFALKLLDRRPELALTRYHGGTVDTQKVSALHLLARKPTSIFS